MNLFKAFKEHQKEKLRQEKEKTKAPKPSSYYWGLPSIEVKAIVIAKVLFVLVSVALLYLAIESVKIAGSLWHWW